MHYFEEFDFGVKGSKFGQRWTYKYCT